MTSIWVRDLCRTYRLTEGRLHRRHRDVEALRGISFEVAPGELFGLAGPNGAGKTTTVRILSTLLEPTTGQARVLGLDVVTQARQVRRQIGILFGGERGLYGRVSGWHNLRYFANLFGLPSAHAGRRIEELLELVGLAERAHDRVDTYSRGMKQRLHLARGLISEPRVLVMDEPTVGLDPVAAREFRGLVDELRAGGATILITTHDLAEAEAVCDRVSFIDGGNLLVTADPRAIGERAPAGEHVPVGGGEAIGPMGRDGSSLESFYLRLMNEHGKRP